MNIVLNDARISPVIWLLSVFIMAVECAYFLWALLYLLGSTPYNELTKLAMKNYTFSLWINICSAYILNEVVGKFLMNTFETSV